MKTKTSELEGAALDYAVAAATGVHDDGEHALMEIRLGRYSPSTDWSQGGPLIERYKAEFRARIDEGFECRIEKWEAEGFGYDEIKQLGTTHLIAAMRAIVAVELGEDVDVPDELKEAKE